MDSFIPVARPDLSGNEEAYVVDAVRSSWISSTGAYVQRFETEFARACETHHAIGVCNGTIALHLALLGLDVRAGDEVIVPSLTYVATANAVRYVGAEPVFVDVDPETWCLDPDRIEEAITPRTRGIIVVHLVGHPADMDRINRIAAVHGLWVVEDAAEALLARYKGRPTGGLGHVGTFSFFGNKMLTCGEGGALTLNDDYRNVRMRTLRGQGMDPNRRYYFPVTGYNFRLTNLACAILCAQFERREQILSRRRTLYANYDRMLEEIPGVMLKPVAPWAELSPWLYVASIDADRFGGNRDQLMAFLAEHQIETRPMFIPLHTLPPFREASRRRQECLPVTDRISQNALMLPTYTQMTPAEQTRVVETIALAQKQHQGTESEDRRLAA